MHQHGGCRGSSGRGATGGGAIDIGSRNWELNVGHNAPGSRGEDGDGDGDCIEANTEPEAKEQKASPDLRLFVDGNEWDLSDVIDINRPCRDYCYWIIKHKNGKKTRISGNVILEEI